MVFLTRTSEWVELNHRHVPVEDVPLDEVVDQVFNSLVQLWFLQRYWVALVGDLHDQFPELVQLALDLEEALRCHGKPAGREGGAALTG